MFNQFLKISLPGGEQRWINIARVTRVSLATDSSGEPVLAFCFDGQDKVVIHGSDAANRAVIQQVAAAFDSSDASSFPSRRAA